MTSPIEAAIFDLLAERDPGKTICPSEAARRIDLDHWRDAMPVAHEAARRLVERGAAVLTQGGAAVAPDNVVGAYRIWLP